MPRLLVNGVEIYYELHGPEEAEVLVLSNGVLMSTASWGLQTPVLAMHYRVLLYDCRGMWRSEHPQGPYTMELHAEDLAALLDALEIQAAHIAGISYGAEVSMAFALKYPERVLSLFLASGVSESDAVLRGFIQTWAAAAQAGNGLQREHALRIRILAVGQVQFLGDSVPHDIRAFNVASGADADLDQVAADGPVAEAGSRGLLRAEPPDRWVPTPLGRRFMNDLQVVFLPDSTAPAASTDRGGLALATRIG